MIGSTIAMTRLGRNLDRQEIQIRALADKRHELSSANCAKLPGGGQLHIPLK